MHFGYVNPLHTVTIIPLTFVFTLLVCHIALLVFYYFKVKITVY